MENPRKIQSVNKPEVIISLENGMYYYNYNITEVEVEVSDMETSDITIETRWEYIQVMLNGTPNYGDIVQSIIRVFVSQNEEFDLINSYNKAMYLGYINDKAISEYKEYIELLDTIKQKVKEDFN